LDLKNEGGRLVGVNLESDVSMVSLLPLLLVGVNQAGRIKVPEGKKRYRAFFVDGRKEEKQR